MKTEVIPIDLTLPCITNFEHIFAALPEMQLDLLEQYFTKSNYDHANLLVSRESLLLLEEMFIKELAGTQIIPLDGSENATLLWLNTHGASFLESRKLYTVNVDEHYLIKNCMQYILAARTLRARISTQSITLGEEYIHPLTHMRFHVPITVDGISYVSMNHVAKRRYVQLFHQLSALMDRRPRMAISQIVYGHLPIQLQMQSKIQMPFMTNMICWKIVRQLAIVANVRISNMVIGLDLEWNNNDPETRFKTGTIVDVHFEEYTTGWVVSSGMIKVPEYTRLTRFLSDRGYTVDKINQFGSTPDEMRTRIGELAIVTNEVLYIAYTGMNSDIQVLYNNNYVLQHYLDAGIFLNAGRTISLLQLYQREFGEDFDAHSASSDTQAMLRIMRGRNITVDNLWTIYNILQELKAFRHLEDELEENIVSQSTELAIPRNNTWYRK